MALGECSCHGYKMRYCPGKAKEGKHANPEKAHLPAPTGKGRGGREVSDAEHKKRCRDQGYRGLSTW